MLTEPCRPSPIPILNWDFFFLFLHVSIIPTPTNFHSIPNVLSCPAPVSTENSRRTVMRVS